MDIKRASAQISSYKKLMGYAVVVLISTLIIAGVFIISAVSAEYKQSALLSLKADGDLFIGCIKDEYTDTGSFTEYAQSLKRQFMSKYDISVSLYDGDGKNVLSAGHSTDSELPLTQRIKLEKADQLEISSESYSSNGPKLIYGTHFYMKDPTADDDTALSYYALFYDSPDQINTYIFRIYLIYIAVAIIGAGLAVALLYMRIRRSMQTEREFLRVCEKYSKGDFSEKLSTDHPGSFGTIAAYVNSVAEDVETSEETSKTFIANVSHELRTPITTIGGFVDGILDGTIPKSRQSEYLILVSKEIQRLRILISSMLNMTRFESGTLTPNFRSTNLTDLVIQTVLMFEKKIESKELDVAGLDSDPIRAIVDPDLIQQVIYNLVENAVKFVNKGGTLSFSFEESGDVRMIGIRNTGEGLKNTEIQQVFDRFYKTDSSRGKDTTGLGLGLSISRKIVHLHHGHIVVKSVVGEYTEFQIQIPYDPTSRKERIKKQ
ncbi:MAG: HAMP domain-containing histidine kinase [Ruminococcus sp.]|nr:HAMP domain-containing histidine kinase [Ruminococcus sp.]MBR2282970.1 HAMP domain-containing histidine kinase [Ruminococcus sp.]